MCCCCFVFIQEAVTIFLSLSGAAFQCLLARPFNSVIFFFFFGFFIYFDESCELCRCFSLSFDADSCSTTALSHSLSLCPSLSSLLLVFASYWNDLAFNVCLKCRNWYKVYNIVCNLMVRCEYVVMLFFLRSISFVMALFSPFLSFSLNIICSFSTCR